MSAHIEFADAFDRLTGNRPFPWQVELYRRFLDGEVPRSCNLPTGLGKTSAIAVWLLALAARASAIPRRLVYVVNRRTVVDQTTHEVEKLRENLAYAGLVEPLRRLCALDHTNDGSPLAISTLRGQFADNQVWSGDPSQPAVICGTVDMIGSRLLFSGYRIGFKSKPLHAAFLGQDALLFHDEAHLEPAFQKLIETIEKEQRREKTGNAQEVTWPALRVMALSATARNIKNDDPDAHENDVLELSGEDHKHPVIKQRIEATKKLTLVPVEDENKDLVDAIVQRTLIHQNSGRAVLVFARKVEDVEKIVKNLPNSAAKQLTGTLRGLERDQLIASQIFQRFLPESNRDPGIDLREGTVYLVCTSAGEVGVNMSAAHLVCDLSTFDSMAQRFGRVNRFGERNDTQIHVIHPTSFERRGKTNELDVRRQKTLDLLKQLSGDATPHALGQLDAEARYAAFAPEPTILPASDILFDAWSLTTIRNNMPGRPPVEPYLHGVTEWEPAQTEVAWRHEVDIINDDLAERFPPKDLLEDYPLKPHELLRDRSDRVFKELGEIAKRCPDSSTWLVSDDGSIELLPINKLADKNHKERINGRTVLLPPSVGGLSDGLLDGKADRNEDVDYDVADAWVDEQGRQHRTRLWDNTQPPDGVALIRTLDTTPDAEEFETENGEPATSTRAKRFWHWYIRPRDAEDVTLASTRPIRLKHHTGDVVSRTRQITTTLQLDEKLQEALVLASALHDLGKRRELWQRGIGNPNPIDWYAKPGKPKNGPRWRPRRISSYRHEFGSLLDILDLNQEYRARLEGLSDAMQELVLHVIAAHHGRARPHFSADESFDPTPGSNNLATEQALETPRRFARLQRTYGRWGLAYLESLLRAADWAASAEPSESEEDNS